VSDDDEPPYKHEVVSKLRWFAETFIGPGKPAADVKNYLRFYDALLQRPPMTRLLPDDAFEAFQALWATEVHEAAYNYVLNFPNSLIPQDTYQNLWQMLDTARIGLAQNMINPPDNSAVKRLLGYEADDKKQERHRLGDPQPATWFDSVTAPTNSSMRLYGNGNIGMMRFCNLQVAGQFVYGDSKGLAVALRAYLCPTLATEDRRHFMGTTISFSLSDKMQANGLLLDVMDRGLKLECYLPPRHNINVQLDNLPNPWPWPLGSYNSSPLKDEKRLYVFVDGWARKDVY
jgi:hypothetical protein